MTRTIILDLETVALDSSELPPFDETSVAVGNLKDPQKIKDKIDGARAEWLEGLALSPMTGRIAMIGWKEVGGRTEIDAQENERDLVGEALTTISEHLAAGNVIAGFNIWSFDLPFLARRAWKHGFRLPLGMRTGRYWARELVDLREEWLLGDRSPVKGTSSLDAISKFLGLPEKLGTGADFAKLTAEQRLAYLQRDLEIEEALWMRMH